MQNLNTKTEHSGGKESAATPSTAASPSLHDCSICLRPEFLSALSQDYPALASRLVEQIPVWKDQVDKLTGIPGLGEAVLRKMEYISQLEESSFFQSVANEIVSMLDKDSSAKFIFVHVDGGAKSGQYFYDKVMEHLSPEQHSRCTLSSQFNTWSAISKDPKANWQIMILDDSTNSGKQLRSILYNLGFLEPVAKPPEPHPVLKFLSKFISESSKAGKISLHLRFMRATTEAATLIESTSKELSKKMHVDFKYKPMSQIEGAIDNISIEKPLSDEARRALVQTGHDWKNPILGFFFHRIQDNLPGFVVRNGRTPEGFRPILTQDDIPKPY